jgi:hypothetical protein
MINYFDIPEEILAQYNITYDELLFLMLSLRGVLIEDITESLLEKHIGRPSKRDPKHLAVRHKEEILVDNILSNYKDYLRMERKKVEINPDYIELAAKMQELYPKGKRPGCSTQWRGNKIIIAKKLTTLVRDYYASFTEEQAIDAVKRYVDSFNGDYSYMECLEYFILREKPTFKTNFLSYLENKGEEEDNNIEFGIKMR